MRRLLALFLLGGCIDLPEGWEDAERLADFTQAECSGSALGGDTGGPVQPEVTAEADGDAVAVSAEPVTFRCAQDVEGFWRASGDGAADVLVQPVEMNPSAVAGCDCLYKLTMTVPVAAPVAIGLYTRGDHVSGRDEPAVIGSAVVE
jgi:hypothetical protein